MSITDAEPGHWKTFFMFDDAAVLWHLRITNAEINGDHKRFIRFGQMTKMTLFLLPPLPPPPTRFESIKPVCISKNVSMIK